MDYMKGYINRNKRRRASRNRTKRKRRSSGGTGYYINRSQYSNSGRRRFSWKYPVAAVAGVFALVLLVLGIGKLFSGNGHSGQVASGSSLTADATPTPSVSSAVDHNSSQMPVNPAATAGGDLPETPEPSATAVSGTNVPVVAGNTEVAQSTDPSITAKAPEPTEAPSATPDPDGIAADIAAVATLAPQAIQVPTPAPKPRSKAVALTFDDGPSTVNTPKVLELLKKYNAHATFFVVGTRVSAGAEVLKQEVAQGCEIGNHTWGHANLSKMSMKKVNKQFNKTADLVQKLIGYDIKLLRPPWGAISQKMRDKLKHPMILWNTDTLDWKSKNPKAILKQVKKQVKDGDIILMHDIHPTTAESLKTVLPWLIKNDYDILTVSELAARKGAPLHNGKAYGGFTGQ